jgi:hypothetical protein
MIAMQKKANIIMSGVPKTAARCAVANSFSAAACRMRTSTLPLTIIFSKTNIAKTNTKTKAFHGGVP